jgi:hypothetical protein
MKEKVTELEMIRRLKEVTADEDKYFPGVLGNPVTFAGRWGLPLSKSYRDFKAKQLAAQKRRWSTPKNGRRSFRKQLSVPKLKLAEFEPHLTQYIKRCIVEDAQIYIWNHIRKRLVEANRLGPGKIARVRHALLGLDLALSPDEQLAFNRADYQDVNHWLDKEVFGA